MKCAILIAIHNNAPTLERTLESLKSQTFQDFRIVAIDDASSDTTPAILKKWQGKLGEDRFTLVTNPTNLGLTRSLNLGLKHINELYTARIDADDWWHPTKLARQVDFLDTHTDHGIVGTWYENHGRHGIKQIMLPETDSDIRSSIFKRNPFAHSAVVFRTEVIKKSGMYNPNWRYGQDYELWLRLLPHTKMANIPEFLCYRTADDTLTARKQREQMLLCVKTQLHYLKLYHRPLSEYRYLIEPLIMIVTPNYIKELKRKFFQ